jgi:hypothetical protein
MAYELLKLILDSETQSVVDKRLDGLGGAVKILADHQDATDRKVQELSAVVGSLMGELAHLSGLIFATQAVLIVAVVTCGVLFYRDRQRLLDRIERLEDQKS